jgi:5,10-methenyltetrahydrofolate synthetase
MSAKQMLRHHFREQRQLGEVATRTIQEAVVNLVGRSICGNGYVGIYWPLPGEADLRPLRDVLHSPLALPVADGGGRLTYRSWTQEPLQPDGCGIPAPAEGEALRPDQLALLLVPALAMDLLGIRLGYGGGYYDRLRADPAWAAIPAWVVLPFTCMATNPLPRDSWDVPFAGWITEQGAGRPA